MLFHSFSFLLFFPLVTGMYFLIPKGAKQLWLLVASYYFYMSWNVQYGCLILLVTAIGYGGGLLLAQNKVRQGKRRLAVLTGSVLLCVGILFFFKYSAFAVQNINELLRAVGSVRALRVPDLILPVGISFYTFQTIGYLIDVWKGKTEAEKSFLRFALFVSFFPQLVAGPIERSSRTSPALRKTPPRISLSQCTPEIRRPTTSMAVTAARRQSTVLRTAALRMRPRSCSMAVGRMHSASHKSVKFRFFMLVFLFEMDCRLPTG